MSIETIAGQLTTVTYYPSSTSTSGAASHNHSSGVSGGTIAGIVIGVIGGIAVIAALLLCVFIRRRSRSDASDAGYDPTVQNTLVGGGGGGGSSGSGPRLSKGSQMSYMRGMFPEIHGPSASSGSSNAPHRGPVFTDNRLKPDTALYANGDRQSRVSLQDNEDYSRPVLRVSLLFSLHVKCTHSLLTRSKVDKPGLI